MIAMNSVEEAYNELGRAVLDFIQTRQWEKGECRCRILNKMASSTCALEMDGIEINKAMGWGDSSIDPGAAALFLRDHLLATTGDRIWGLTFTLYPDGKFKIEYDYNKPEGYEETDENISLDEALKGLPNSGNPQN